MEQKTTNNGASAALVEIKKKLLERKLELESLMEKDRIEPHRTDDAQDIGDQAQQLSIELLKVSLQGAEQEEYNMVLRALQMIQEGTYGICSECQQPISERRLRLYPNATRCLSCQEALEEAQKAL